MIFCARSFHRMRATKQQAMRRLATPLKWVLVAWRVVVAAAQDTFIDVTLKRCVLLSILSNKEDMTRLWLLLASAQPLT